MSANKEPGRPRPVALPCRRPNLSAIPKFRLPGLAIFTAFAAITFADATEVDLFSPKLGIEARAEVRHILLERPAKSVNSRFPKRSVPSDVPLGVFGTVKLASGGWLHGRISIEDGTFAVVLADGSTMRFARGDVQWICLGKSAVEANGFDGSAIDLLGWVPAESSGRLELADGVATIKGVSSIGRMINPPDRFQVTLNLPSASEDHTALLLQPISSLPNHYTTGTIQLQFGRKELTHCFFTREIKQDSTPILPLDGGAPAGSVVYRLLYDSPEKRFAVLRDGEKVGEWSLAQKEEPGVKKEQERVRPIRAICLERSRNGIGGSPMLRSLRIAPWDGVIPQPGTRLGPDLLYRSKHPFKGGRLEKIEGESIVFAGGTMAVEEGMWLDLSGMPPRSAPADAVLGFAGGGMPVSSLVIAESTLEATSGSVPSFEIPTSALASTNLLPRHVPVRGPGDRIVFRNGDELGGKFQSVAEGGAFQWETSADTHPVAAGQIAGEKPVSVLELLGGDRLRSNLTAWDATHVLFLHEQVGTLKLPHEVVGAVYPTTSQGGPAEGGDAPQVWIEGGSKSERLTAGRRGSESRSNAWRHFDDSYFLNSGSRQTQFRQKSLRPPIGRLPEMCEIRVTGIPAPGGRPSFGLVMKSGDGSSLQAGLGWGGMQLTIQDVSPEVVAGG